MDQEERLKKAKKIVEAKLGFIRHFIIYFLVILALAIINNFTSGGYQWWLWVAFGWGIGVLANFLAAFVFGAGALEDRLLKSELEKMDDKQ